MGKLRKAFLKFDAAASCGGHCVASSCQGKLRSSLPKFGQLNTVLTAVTVGELLLTGRGKFRYS
jgi:hypothetical protein